MVHFSELPSSWTTVACLPPSHYLPRHSVISRTKREKLNSAISQGSRDRRKCKMIWRKRFPGLLRRILNTPTAHHWYPIYSSKQGKIKENKIKGREREICLPFLWYKNKQCNCAYAHSFKTENSYNKIVQKEIIPDWEIIPVSFQNIYRAAESLRR